MKRKVQAQRKFAHGAYVPNNNGSVPERRLLDHTHAQTKDDHTTNIIHNNMTARNLLDIVSLKNVHRHGEPIVVLERLQPSSSMGCDKKKTNIKSINPKKIISLKQIKKKKRDKPIEDGMCLRSRSIIKPKFKKISRARKKLKARKLVKTLGDDRILRNRKSKTKNENVTISQRNVCVIQDTKSVNEFSLDDEKPLKYFAKNGEPVSEMSVVLSESENRLLSNLIKPMLVEAQLITPLPSTPQKINDGDNVPLHESNLDANAENLTSLKEVGENTVYSGSCFYGINGIERWLKDSMPSEEVETIIDNMFKTPQPPTKRVRTLSNQELEHTHTSPLVQRVKEQRLTASLPCPSVNLVTIKDIIAAPNQELERFCKQCDHCKKINKVKRQSSALQVPSELAYSFNGDIYDLDNDTCIIDNGASTASTSFDELNNNGEPVYLDLLHNSSKYVVMVKVEKLQNQNKKILRARLVPKSEATSSRNYPVAFLEKLLDGLLKKASVTIKNGSDSCNTSSTGANQKQERRQTPGQSPQSGKQKNEKKPQNPNQESSSPHQHPKLVDAPVFYPTKEEFSDPISYFNKIMPTAYKFGLCKVVAPKDFRPDCTLSDKIKFTVINQYIHRMYTRWGPSAREMCAIKAYLALQKVFFTKPPLVEGMEVNLPKLYHVVKDTGGINNVIEKKRWGKVAEQMRYPKGCNSEKKLDQVYVKFVLPYGTLSLKERQQIIMDVEKCWNKKSQKMLDRALNPLHRQMRLLGEAESSEDETEDEGEVAGALNEAEDCVVQGRRMHLDTFKKVAANVMHTHFPVATFPPVKEVELTYWSLVLLCKDHVCVNTASIDTGDEGYGFTKNEEDPYGTHSWNLKMLSQNKDNILRSMGPVLGVTVPTLHLGMVFSTSCWHRDPHGLPWIEYMHTGPDKIWYGIPNEQSDKFRKAVEVLCPSFCQNKSVWLPSDIAMIPPNLLMEHNVSLSRVVQKPREFIIVFPKAYSCSISTGYTVSESVYFATSLWLKTVHQVFQELGESCEPSMFSLDQLLIAAAQDPRVSLSVLHQISGVLFTIISEETSNRQSLLQLGVQSQPRSHPNKKHADTWNTRDHEECDFCRTTLYLSQVAGLTGNKSAMCLRHALRLLEKPKFRNRPMSELTLYTFFSKDELETIVSDVEKRLLNINSSTN